MKWDRLTLAVGAAALVVLGVVVITPLVNIAAEAYSIRPDITPSNAIVVLGSGILRDGSLTNQSLQRLVLGMRLYKEGLAPILVLSGPGRSNTPTEAAARARIATDLGIPRSAILEIVDVKTTRDEAIASAGLLLHRGLNHILLVTEPLHMRRAKMVFQAEGFNVSAAPSDNFPAMAVTPVDRMSLLEDLLMHAAGLVYYRMAGYI